MPYPLNYATPDAPRPRGRRPDALPVGCVVAALGVAGALVYSGSAVSVVAYRLLTDGLTALAWVASAAGLGAFPVRMLLGGGSPFCGEQAAGDARATPDAPRPALLSFATAAALGLGLLGLVILGLGLAGWLNRFTAVLLLVPGAFLGIAFLFRRNRDGKTVGDTSRGRPASRWRWLWLAAAPFLSVALVGTMVPPGVLWNPQEPHGYDVAEYHLQVPREWYEAGRIVPLKHNVFSYFPMGVEVHYLLAMHLGGGPWDGMYLAQLMHLALIVLTVLAACGFALRLAPNRASATLAGVSLATLPWLTQLGAVAYNEGGFLLYGALAAGWAMLALPDSLDAKTRLRRFALGGAMAGFACGTKLTAVPEVLLGVPLVSATILLVTAHGRPRYTARAALSVCAIFLLTGLLMFSPWLVRNAVWAGNPVFPEATGLMGKAHFTDAQVRRWHDANHLPGRERRGIFGRVGAAGPQILGSWQFGYVLLPLSAVAIFLALVARIRITSPGAAGNSPRFDGAVVRSNRGSASGGPSGSTRGNRARVATTGGDDLRVTLLFPAGMLLLLSVFWLGFTHLQGRFFLLAAPLGVMLVARLDWGRGLPVVAALVLFSALCGAWELHRRIAEDLRGSPTKPGGMTDALGRTPLDWLTPAALDAFPKGPAAGGAAGDRVVLVGEARAFWYQIPMSRLRYRTVFDVDFGNDDAGNDPGRGDGRAILDAWSGLAPGLPRPAGEWVLIDGAELRRFSETYFGVPPPPAPWVVRGEAILLRPGDPVPP